MVGGLASLGEFDRVLSVSWALFETFPACPRSFLPDFLLLRYSSSFFTLAVPMLEVYCVVYTPRAWDPRVKWSLVFRSFRTFPFMFTFLSFRFDTPLLLLFRCLLFLLVSPLLLLCEVTFVHENGFLYFRLSERFCIN